MCFHWLVRGFNSYSKIFCCQKLVLQLWKSSYLGWKNVARFAVRHKASHPPSSYSFLMAETEMETQLLSAGQTLSSSPQLVKFIHPLVWKIGALRVKMSGLRKTETFFHTLRLLSHPEAFSCFRCVDCWLTPSLLSHSLSHSLILPLLQSSFSTRDTKSHFILHKQPCRDWCLSLYLFFTPAVFRTVLLVHCHT